MNVRTTVKSIQDIMRQDVGVDGDAQRISQLCWVFFLKIIDDQDRELELMQEEYRSPIPAAFQWRAWAADPEGMTGDAALMTFVNDELFPTLKELPGAIPGSAASGSSMAGRRRAAVVLPDGTLFGEGVKTRLKEHLLEECNLHTIVRLPNSVFKPYASIGTNLLFFEKGAPTQDIWYYEHQIPAGQKAYSMTRPIRLEHLRPCRDWWGGAKREGRTENEVAWRVTIDEIKARNYNLDFKNPHTVEENHGDPAALLAKLEESEAETARLRNHFDEISEAPDAIPRLRRFILDLAVRGKLVEQDPSDEPVSELLERIETEKAARTKEGIIRKPRQLPPIKREAMPYQLPKTWLWVRIGNMFDYDIGSKTEPKQLHKDSWLLELEDIEKDSGKIIQRLAVAERAPKSTKSGFQSGDVLYGKLRPYLNKTVVEDCPGFSTTEIVALRCYGESMPHYTYLALRRPDFVDYVARLGQGTKMPRLRTEDAVLAPFPLPSLAEQHRIVAKVDELMAMCDKLKNRITITATTRRQLLEATLQEALSM